MGTRRKQKRQRGGIQRLKVPRRRLTDQTQRLREGTRRIRWRLQHPRPNLKQTLSEKKRRLQFDVQHMKPATKKKWMAGGVTAGILGPVLGGLLAHVLKPKKRAS